MLPVDENSNVATRKRKMKKTVLLCCILLTIGLGLIFSGVVSYRPAGICFGKCEQDRRAEFDSIFPQWLAREAECGPRGEEDRELIAALNPGLLPDIDAKNQEFAALSVREQNGALSLGERNEYLADPWRVVLMAQKEYRPGDFLSATLEELSYDEHPTWIRECLAGGLVSASYCEGFVSVRLKTVSGGFFSNGTVPFNHQTYTYQRDIGEIDTFISRMEADRSRDYELRRSAENQVQAMPASEFPEKSDPIYEVLIENRVEQIYLEGKCR